MDKTKLLRKYNRYKRIVKRNIKKSQVYSLDASRIKRYDVEMYFFVEEMAHLYLQQILTEIISDLEKL